MASLYSASRAPMASSSSGEKGSRSRSWRTERTAFCDCQRQSSHCLSGTSRQSGWRLGLPGGSSSSKPYEVLSGSDPVRSSDSSIKIGYLQLDSDIQVRLWTRGRVQVHLPINPKI